MFWRLTAQRLLVERGELDVLPQLYEMVRDQKIDKLGLNPGALHALWTIDGLGALDGSRQDTNSTFKANVSTVMERVSKHYALGTNPSSSIAGYLFKLEEAEPVIGLGFLTGIAEDWPEEEIPSFSEEEKKLLYRVGSNVPETYQQSLYTLADTWELPELFGKKE